MREILGSVVRSGLSEEILLNRIWNKEKKKALQISRGKAFRADGTAFAKGLSEELFYVLKEEQGSLFS